MLPLAYRSWPACFFVCCRPFVRGERQAKYVRRVGKRTGIKLLGWIQAAARRRWRNENHYHTISSSSWVAIGLFERESGGRWTAQRENTGLATVSSLGSSWELTHKDTRRETDCELAC